MGDSMRTFHPYYTPINRVISRVTNGGSPEIETPTTKRPLRAKKNGRTPTSPNGDLTTVKRQPTVRIKRKSPKSGTKKVVLKPEGEDTYEVVVELREYWLGLFEQTMGVQYDIGSETKQMNLCDSILDRLRDPDKVRAFMSAFLTREELGWVDNKTLEWLARPSNLSRVAPVLMKKKKTTARAEFSGHRSPSPKIIFRSI